MPTFDLASTPSGKARISGAQGLFGGSLTAWSDSRSDSGDILVQQLDDDGNPGATGIISTPTCAGVPNSTGFPSSTFVLGSDSAAANDNTLYTTGLPSLATSFFITSRTPGFVVGPGSSMGNLCLGGDIGRFVGPGQVLFASPQGGIRLELDLTQQPTPTGLVTVLSGEQWYFQAWHRDVIPPLGPVSNNFSEACSVIYQ